MSAIADSTDGPVEQVKVLFALFPGYNTLDVAGPLEVLSRSLQDPKDKCKINLSMILGRTALLSELLLTFHSEQGFSMPVRGHRSCHDFGSGPHHQG
jgi:hypothetical protein